MVRDKVELQPARESRATWRARLGLNAEDVVGCMLAHLHPGKDHATVLRAWRLVVDSSKPRESAQCYFSPAATRVGATPRKRLRSILNLRDRVRFVGEVSDVSGFLSAADLAVFSSRSELLPAGARRSPWRPDSLS